MSDITMLWTMRVVMALFAVAAVVFAVNTDGTMYEMVQNAYKVTLTMAFVPLAAGVYWKRATTQGALGASLLGLAGWLVAEVLSRRELGLTELETPLWWHLSIIPPQMYGLTTSILGMILGSLTPQIIPQAEPDDAALKRTSTLVGH